MSIYGNIRFNRGQHLTRLRMLTIEGNNRRSRGKDRSSRGNNSRNRGNDRNAEETLGGA